MTSTRPRIRLYDPNSPHVSPLAAAIVGLNQRNERLDVVHLPLNDVLDKATISIRAYRTESVETTAIVDVTEIEKYGVPQADLQYT